MKEIIIDGVTYICTPKEEKAVKNVEHEYVDLGLPSGRLWATCNIGAEKPTDCGDYFACGVVEPYDINDCDRDFFNEIEAANLSEMYDEHDSAKVLWGDEWRMPTLNDFVELIEHCTYRSEVIDGMMCGVYTSKSNNKKIVMPASGFFDGGSLDERGRYGYYWSRSFSSSSGAWLLSFDSISESVSVLHRGDGFTVRPVRG